MLRLINTIIFMSFLTLSRLFGTSDVAYMLSYLSLTVPTCSSVRAIGGLFRRPFVKGVLHPSPKTALLNECNCSAVFSSQHELFWVRNYTAVLNRRLSLLSEP